MIRDRDRGRPPPRRRVRAGQRRARVPPPQLPPVLRRPARVPRRDVDAAGRPGLAGPRPHERPVHPRAGHGARLPAGARPRAVRRADRGRAAQAPDADRHPGRPDDPRVRPVRAHGRRTPSQVWQILVLATILGITNAVDMPTRQAFTVEMVGREDVPNAVALNSAIFNGARIVGPAIAGLTIGAFGGDVSPAFLLNGLSFLAVIIAYAAMRKDELDPQRRVRPATLRARGRRRRSSRACATSAAATSSCSRPSPSGSCRCSR